MDQKVKEKWVAALRSGEYEQTKSCLQDLSGFCCLGVLTDLYIKETGDGGWRERYEEVYHGLDDWSQEVLVGYFHGSESELPIGEVMDWADLDVDEMVDIGGVEAKLYEHNDAGASFAQIADAIEGQL